MPVRQVEGAGAQHLLKPLFWGKTVYNYGHRSQEVDVIWFPFLFLNTLRVGDNVHAKPARAHGARRAEKNVEK